MAMLQFLPQQLQAYFADRNELVNNFNALKFLFESAQESLSFKDDVIDKLHNERNLARNDVELMRKALRLALSRLDAVQQALEAEQ